MDDTYAWDVVAEEACFKRITLFTNGDVEKKSSFAIAAALKDAFAQIGPDVAAIPGWFGRPALLALALCRKMGIPALVMSDSTEHDLERYRLKEWIKNGSSGISQPAWSLESFTTITCKSWVCRATTSSMVMGRRQRSFLIRGSLCPEQTGKTASPVEFMENGFLGSSRFIARKHIDAVIRAYAEYRTKTGSQGWKLVLLGDGH